MNRKSSRIEVRPIELVEANKFVTAYHRHHKSVVSHRFSICAVSEAKIVGVAIVGRPVARMTDQLRTIEVTRLCTDGTPNACSALYAAAARVGSALGFEKIQTFVLESESGHSLRATGWEFDGVNGGGQWKHSDGKPRRTDQPTESKSRWCRHLNPRLDFERRFVNKSKSLQTTLFEEDAQ